MKNIGFLFFVFFTVSSAHAVSDTGRAVQRIIPALKMTRLSDLNFGIAEPGAPSKRVAPGNAENEENASFKVMGEPARTYSIQLPSDHDVVMVTRGGGTSQTEIKVSQFQSSPLAVGTLNDRGESTLFVGATRDKIRDDQIAGLYEAVFTVTVLY